MRHFLMAAGLALSLAVVGCGGEEPAEPVDAGKDAGHKPDTGVQCDRPLCGDICCEAHEQCNPIVQMCEIPCQRVCDGKECGPDLCGDVCGLCAVGMTCNAAGRCEDCTESDAQFCARLGKTCGPASGTDRCNQPRNVAECGPCTGSQVCSATGVCLACTPVCGSNVCGDNGCGGTCGTCPPGTACSDGQCAACTPNCGAKVCGVDSTGCSCGVCPGAQVCNAQGACEEPCTDTDVDFCARNDRTCGSFSGTDKCGKPRTVTSCGACSGTQSCNAQGQCVEICTDTDVDFCARHGRTCGAFSGTDKCGLPRAVTSCGSCTGGATCNAAGTCGACTGESDAVFCANKGKQCGPASGLDNCGVQRTVANCQPGCTTGQTCSAAGTCVSCTGESDAVFCANKGKQCGLASGLDNCGVHRTVANCQPGCASGQTCTAAGTCSNCTPQSDALFCAGMGRYCGPASGNDNCGAWRTVASCPPGCSSGQACTNGRCETAAACSASNCNGPGMSCQVLETGAPAVCTCLPDSNTTDDSCVASGKVCDFDWDNPGPAQCRIPGEFEICQAAVGCQPGFQCTFIDATLSACLRPCTSSMDCPSLNQSCTPDAPEYYEWARNKCFDNTCAYPDDPGAGMTADDERAFYFQPCGVMTVTGTDGTCYPQRRVNADGTAYIDRGTCAMNGSVPAYGACDPFANKTSLSQACGPNLVCKVVMDDGAGGYRGICTPACNAAATPTPAQACGGGQYCRDVSGFPWENNGSSIDGMTKARVGVCEKSCALFGTDVCPNDALGNQAGCFPLAPFDGRGYCRAQMPGAKGLGQDCAVSDLEIRNPCGDRLACSADVCVGWCSTAVCPVDTQACTSCKPAGYACKGLMTQPPQPLVGLCGP